MRCASMTSARLFCIVFVSLCAQGLCAEELPTVAVLDLRVAEGLPASAGRDLADVIRSEIVKTGKFRLLNRENMQQILDEQDISQSERCDDTSCLVKVGKMLAVQRMVGGNVSKLGRTYKLYLSFTNVSTGKVVNSLTERYRGEIDMLFNVAAASAWRLMGLQLPTDGQGGREPGPFQRYLRKAQQHFLLEQYAEALGALDEADRVKPRDARAADLRMRVQAARRDADKGAIEKRLASLVRDAQAALDRGDWLQADKVASTILVVRPSDQRALQISEQASLQGIPRWRLEKILAREMWSELASARAAVRSRGVARAEVSKLLATAGLVVRFTSKPSGADVFLDGGTTPSGRTPYNWVWDGRGSVSYRISLDAYPGEQGVLRLDPRQRSSWAIETRLTRERTVLLPDGTAIALMWIAPGEFQMGSLQADADTRLVGKPWPLRMGSKRSPGVDCPQHPVRITKAFWLGQYEVTQEQWKAVMTTRPWEGEKYGVSNPSHAANYLSWDQCQDFVRKLNDLLPGWDFRLPTEAEWEYACRAGTTTRFHYGDDPVHAKLGEYAWYHDNASGVGEKYAHPVGRKKPNAWGLYDMHGNVYEWCQDLYDWGYYAKSVRDDPRGPTKGFIRVLRGGSWAYPALHCYSWFRFGTVPSRVSYHFGVRIASSVADND